MNTLVHICCAPCLLGPLEELQQSGFAGYFYNPNIHGLIEFRRRLKSLRVLADRRKFSLQADESYGLNDYMRQVEWSGPSAARCRSCYRLRLRRTAEVARQQGFAAFSTTLLVSLRQSHDALREVGEEVADEIGVPFAYYDWRHLAKSGAAAASRLNLYRQSYCGCIFSEQERYEGTRLHCYKGDDEKSNSQSDK